MHYNNLEMEGKSSCLAKVIKILWGILVHIYLQGGGCHN